MPTIHSLPKDVPGYLDFERNIITMINALENFFMTAHNLLVALDTIQVPDTDTRAAIINDHVKEAEKLVDCLTTVVEALADGRDAVLAILPAEEVEVVDPRAIGDGVSAGSSSESDPATGLITAVDTVDISEDNNATEDASGENEDQGVSEGHSDHALHDPATISDITAALDAPEEGNPVSAEMQELLDLFAATFGTDEGLMNRPINSLLNNTTINNTTAVNQSTEIEDEHTLEPESEHDDPHAEPGSDSDTED